MKPTYDCRNDLCNSIIKKNILITGGSGSIGSHLLDFLLNKNINKIIIFSNEKIKLNSMEKKYNSNPKKRKIEFVTGDIRNFNEVNSICKNVDVIVHGAAIKHVPESELNPYNTIITNIVGGNNLCIAAIQNNVKKVLNLSTDKAADPVNIMGMTKFLQEKIFLNQQSNSGVTKFACIRFGNVLGSFESVTEIFKKSFQNRKPAIVTHNNMIRFIMSFNDTINSIVFALENMEGGEIFI